MFLICGAINSVFTAQLQQISTVQHNPVNLGGEVRQRVQSVRRAPCTIYSAEMRGGTGSNKREGNRGIGGERIGGKRLGEE